MNGPHKARNGPDEEPEPGALVRTWRFLTHDIWLIEMGSMSLYRARGTHALRVFLIAVRGFFRDRCTQQAAALTYITIFSIIPLLAVVFATAKGFGADTLLRGRIIDPFLDSTFGTVVEGQDDPAAQLRRAVDDIFLYVKDTSFAALGTFGFVVLLYLVVKMLGSVERSLNEIWGIKRARSVVRKVTDYLAILVIAPLFLVAGSGLALYLNVDAVEPLLALVSFLTICFGFGFVLFTLPNTKVRLSAALLGGLISGASWQLLQILHLRGQVTLAGWNPIYSSFAALPLLLLWIYLSWVMLLLGAEFSFAAQNEAAFTSARRTGVVDHALRESLAVRLAARIARSFLDGIEPPTAAYLAMETEVAPRVALQVLDDLVGAGLCARTVEGEEEGYLPARDPQTVTVADLLEAVRRAPEARPLPAQGELDREVDGTLIQLEAALRGSEANRTLRDLARAGEGDPRPS